MFNVYLLAPTEPWLRYSKHSSGEMKIGDLFYCHLKRGQQAYVWGPRIATPWHRASTSNTCCAVIILWWYSASENSCHVTLQLPTKRQISRPLTHLNSSHGIRFPCTSLHIIFLVWLIQRDNKVFLLILGFPFLLRPHCLVSKLFTLLLSHVTGVQDNAPVSRNSFCHNVYTVLSFSFHETINGWKTRDDAFGATVELSYRFVLLWLIMRHQQHIINEFQHPRVVWKHGDK